MPCPLSSHSLSAWEERGPGGGDLRIAQDTAAVMALVIFPDTSCTFLFSCGTWGKGQGRGTGRGGGGCTSVQWW
jgi:hypothetical protein